MGAHEINRRTSTTGTFGCSHKKIKKQHIIKCLVQLMYRSETKIKLLNDRSF